MTKGFFITGTDTGVGKTVATFVLGTLLQQRGIDVGIMKPVQCGGNDAVFLRRKLNLADPLAKINPYFAPEPLSPHLAFRRKKEKIDPARIRSVYDQLQSRHTLILVEGAGGLLVPLSEKYLVADMIRDLGLEVIIVARAGLGTINHSLLTIEQARQAGLKVRGIVFNATTKAKPGIIEQTNPSIIERMSGVPVLGTIPRLKNLNTKEALKCSSDIYLSKLLTKTKKNYRRSARHLEDWDKKYLWHPFTQMRDWENETPLVIDEAQGCYLKDIHGNRYLDGISSLWVNVHGHRQPVIDRAVKEQVNRLSHSTLLGLSNTPAIELAKELIGIAPRGLKKVFYSDNGSTAVEVAVKMAYQYWQNTGKTGKKSIVHLNNSYHGDTLGSVSVGGIGLFHKVYGSLTFKTIQFDLPDFYRESKTVQSPRKHLAKLEVLFKKNHAKIAAFVVEPLIQGAAGMLVWPQGMLKGIERLCRKYDILLIADEVATGFGRTGKMFACEHEGVVPDFLCLAKGLTGGYLPLAATLTTQRIYDGFVFDYEDQKTFFHGHTYTGNPLSCAAALASLEVFKKEKTLSRLQPKIKYLSEGLKMFYNLSHVGEVRQKGFMVGIELVRNKQSKEPYPWEERIGIKVCQAVRKHGVILRPLGNVIVLMPPLSISKIELQRILDAAYEAIEQVTETKS